MAGLRGCTVRFPDRVPSYEALKGRAEVLGGLPLVFDAATWHIAFVHVPDRAIDLQRYQRERSLYVTDRQHSSPVLFDLMVRAGVDLGGESPYAGEPQPMPLTPEYVDREYRRYRRAGNSLGFLFLGVLLVIALLLAGFAWAAWHAIASLFGGQ